MVPESTASICVMTSRCSVSAANTIPSYPGVLNFLKGLGDWNLTGLFAQELTSVSLGGINHQKCELTGKICRQEGKSLFAARLERLRFAVMLRLHRRGCSFWFPHRCFITLPHLSRRSFPNCVCFTHVSPSMRVYSALELTRQNPSLSCQSKRR